MLNWLKSFSIFGAMIATPFLLNMLVHLKSGTALQSRLGGIISNEAVTVATVLIAFIGLVLLIFLYERLERIATYLKIAERDLNNILSSALEHGSRKSRVAERADWNRMTATPSWQIFNEGYRTVAHDLVAENEKELQGKGAAIGKASITAFLLRELYEGNVENAQSKVLSDTMNSGKTPYVAPGIRELIGFKHFTHERGFSARGVDWSLLQMTVLFWRFPRDILMVKTDKEGNRTPLRNWEVLAALTEQKI